LEEILQFLLPFLTGGSLGLIGGGGTILAVPILIYIFHQDPKTAIGMGLGIVSILSLAGSYSHWKKGNIRLERAAFFTPFAMLGAFIGAKIANLPQITGRFQMILFGIIVVVSSSLMIFKNNSESTEERFEDRKQVFYKANLVIAWKTVALLGLQGGLVGILTGLVGVGGGFLIVPALVVFGKTPIRIAIGTSLVIIFFNSMSGFLGYLGKVPMDWKIAIRFLVFAVPGVFLGASLAQRVSKQRLQKLFGIFLVLMGIWILSTQLLNF